MSVATYTKAGAKATTPAKLSASVFNLDIKTYDLLKLAYLSHQSKARQNNAVTKTRGLVRGGGKKPWRQKGTGRARVGSSRTPVWRGGGITFGPTGQENYVKQLNRKAKRLAVAQALTLASKDNKVIIIESLALKEAKTQELAKLLSKIDAKRNVLIVVEAKTPELVRSARNLPQVNVLSAKYLNVFDLLNADTVVLDKLALEAINEAFKSKKANT